MTTSTLGHRSCRLTYDVEGSGPPVVLIQGVGIHGAGWTPQVAALRERFQCLTFDNRGMGQSQPQGVPITVEQMAEDTACLMDHIGWESAHVIAHSLGGLVALHLALTRRARVRSLSLLCTLARGRDATRLSGRMLWLGLRSRIGSSRMRRRAFLQIVMPPHALAGVDLEEMAAGLAPLFGHDLADQPPVAMKQLAALRAYDATAHLSEIVDVPTLVVSAARDPIATPRSGRALAGGIPGARYVEFSQASHGVPIQLSAEVNAMLLEHLLRAERTT
jgi:pimeloyl-ACP methyl ester carboxylesterase